jgi:hypothetical protein
MLAFGVGAISDIRRDHDDYAIPADPILKVRMFGLTGPQGNHGDHHSPIGVAGEVG